MDEKQKVEGNEKSRFITNEKIENFFYYYKWHTVVALFLIVVFVVLSFQTCRKTEYDAKILYAGTYEIKHTSSDGNIAPYVSFVSSLKEVCDDYNSDDNVNISLLNLFVLNKEEANLLLEKHPGMEINSTLVKEDSETLVQTLLYGEYFVCFLSERLFLEYEEKYGGLLFAKVDKYLSDDTEYELVSECGVYLRSLNFYTLPEIEKLPQDTVVCIRALSDVSTRFNKKENKEAFRRGEEIITNIFAYE